MKRIIFTLVCSAFMLTGFAQLKMPAPSPTAMVKQNFSLGAIELTYSRPIAKGRTIFGDLVPYDKVWRTGANAATLIKFTEEVEIMGKKIDTGTYALYTIPGQNTWQIILNKGVSNWGSDSYKESDDVARFTVKSFKSKTKAESFTMEFTSVLPSTCILEIRWDRTMVALPITAYNFNVKMRANVEQAMANMTKKPYWQAAQFYNEYDKDAAKALENINMAVKDNPKAFYMWLYKAKIEKDMGDKVAAKASANTSLELAKQAKNEDYIKMNQDLLKKL